MKKVTIRQMASIKRTAMNVASFVARRNTLYKKYEAIKDEFESLQSQIDAFETGVVSITGGLTSQALIKKVVNNVTVNTPEGDKTTKVTKYVVNSDVAKLSADGKYYEIVEGCDLAHPTETSSPAGTPDSCEPEDECPAE